MDILKVSDERAETSDILFVVDGAEPLWKCELFGTPMFLLHVGKTHVPNVWVRFWMWVFFGTKWEKPGKDK